MPLDGKGVFRHNTESARMHTKAAGMDPDNQHSEGKNTHELEDHGDGTFSTHHPEHGSQEHPTLGHALAHMAHHHAEDGHKHMHIHHDGETVHSHAAGGGGEQESREGGMDEAHQHLDEHMGDGGEGAEEDQPGESESGDGLEGLY
jgi:hypothetical protein